MFSLRKARSGFGQTIDLFGSGFLQVVEPQVSRTPDPRAQR